ncbi:hypothetical protein Hanom_Chr09g00815931 [Helianthus anomalus]
MGNGLRGEVDQTNFSPNREGSGGVPKEVCFNWQPFLDSCSGNVPKPSGTVKSDLHFFKASKKAKRYRKGGPCCQQGEKGASPSFVLDSSDRSRPKKRNRGNLEADSDPFSLDNLFELLKNKEGGGGSVHHEVNLNHPLNSDGVPVAADDGGPGVDSAQFQAVSGRGG